MGADAVLAVKYVYHHPRSQAEKRHSIHGSRYSVHVYLQHTENVFMFFPSKQLPAKCLLPAKEDKESNRSFSGFYFSLVDEMSTRGHSSIDVYQKSDSSS